MKSHERSGRLQGMVYWTGVVAVGLTVGLGLQFAQAWVSPPLSPPNGNVAGPVTVGSGAQYKTGKLGVETSATPQQSFEVGGSALIFKHLGVGVSKGFPWWDETQDKNDTDTPILGDAGSLLVKGMSFFGGKAFAPTTQESDPANTLVTKDYADSKGGMDFKLISCSQYASDDYAGFYSADAANERETASCEEGYDLIYWSMKTDKSGARDNVGGNMHFPRCEKNVYRNEKGELQCAAYAHDTAKCVVGGLGLCVKNAQGVAVADTPASGNDAPDCTLAANKDLQECTDGNVSSTGSSCRKVAGSVSYECDMKDKKVLSCDADEYAVSGGSYRKDVPGLQTGSTAFFSGGEVDKDLSGWTVTTVSGPIMLASGSTDACNGDLGSIESTIVCCKK
jgi:hypothetical protein